MQRLADGAFHSGTDLGQLLGVTRAAIHKAIEGLEQQGLEVHRVTGRGYRLSEPFVPLSKRAVSSLLTERGVQADIELLEETESTNEHLLKHRGRHRDQAAVVLAEAQSAGRGRRGRGWVSTPYHNLVLSIAWTFEGGPSVLAGLSLAAGVAVLRALDAFGVPQAGLKWPNDILLNGRKLAGLLVDLRGEANGPSHVVLGLGLNVFISEHDAARIDQPWTALREVLPGPIDRNRLAALLVAEFVNLLRHFEAQGFEPWRAEWERRHLYHNQQVTLHSGERNSHGTVAGVDAQGNLLLRDAHGTLSTCHAGEVSLRAGTTS